jgi:class 3 adenylate cyclase/pimeloyl-ACP methyl ester carboxylesterase
MIRYAKTADGVSLAYWTFGSGPLLLLSPHGMMSHISAQFQIPQIRRWLDLVGSRYTVLQYDYRGFGSSQRDPSDVSLDTMVLDIDTVTTAASFKRFALFGSLINGAIACAYAARHPTRVSHLILWCAGWGGPKAQISRSAEALDEVALKDWNLYSRLRMQAQWGWSEQEQARAYARVLRDSTDAETFIRTRDVWKSIEIEHLLGGLSVPTLVVRSDSRAVPNPDCSRRLAASISGARLVTARAADYVPWLSEEAALEGIGILAEFLEGVAPDEARPLPKSATQTEAGTAIILFADIADSTAMTERMGDAAFREKARTLDNSLRTAVRDHGGAVIDAKTLGDGILATFPAASQAIAASLACGAAGNDAGLPLHLGLHAGDVIRESDNVFGGAVNIAARISALAAPGEVLVSRTVADLARTSAGVTFDDRGEHVLKGIAEPQRVFAVRTGGS